jgi:hypothetical protein
MTTRIFDQDGEKVADFASETDACVWAQERSSTDRLARAFIAVGTEQVSIFREGLEVVRLIKRSGVVLGQQSAANDLVPLQPTARKGARRA